MKEGENLLKGHIVVKPACGLTTYACPVSDCHGFTILLSPSVMPSSPFHYLLQLERAVRTNPTKNKKQ